MEFDKEDGICILQELVSLLWSATKPTERHRQKRQQSRIHRGKLSSVLLNVQLRKENDVLCRLLGMDRSDHKVQRRYGPQIAAYCQVLVGKQIGAPTVKNINTSLNYLNTNLIDP